jgi:hypothetical protein
MSDSWRLAKSLIVLTSEIEYAYPDTTVWDIGDQAHQDSWSDHNPNECCDVVCAVDVLPDRGLNLSKFVAHLIADPHPNLRYVIFNEVIYQRKNGFDPQEYNGPNKHKGHAHVSVGNGPDGRSTSNYDSTASWSIDDLDDVQTPPKPSKPSKPSTGAKLGDRMPTLQKGNRGARVRMLQGLLLAWGYKLKIDGIFGDITRDAVLDFQSKYAKPRDGIVGSITWNALLGIK